MNTILQSVLLNQSKRYKSNYEQHEKCKQLYQRATTDLETAQLKRQKLLSDLELLEQNPSKVKETLGLYDRVIIPELKKAVKEADRLRIRYNTVNWYDPDVILFICVAFALSIPCFFIGEIIIGCMVASVVWVMVVSVWFVYRRILRRMAFQGGIR